MIPFQVWLVGSLLVASAIGAMLMARDVWPFSHYPMFSGRSSVESVVVFRIALEERGGQVAWWRPRFFRLQDRLCVRFEELARQPPFPLRHSPALLELFAQTKRLILADASSSSGCTAVLFIRRRVERSGAAFTILDDVVARFPFTGTLPSNPGGAELQ